ncbi:transcriptional regulator, LuxR family [Catenulispora acidiphila DSM 44928]|uniref:Transcriptional regulator, LuxR family n=1 Tax=Catenulispora acidiphila (strain DSM 44928 / JCM 14897 / NBRC 102108 / NRRL B-24433 / ID139908) TaxID=479433 RepID=C7Q3M0_CATAD|nr:LuxR family transcriptional regulator [Catenulispora acidiphila]ACU75785.1 transcriptional regulator, LuxR family [Catenulispora acidiphila DSM 44928]
MEAGKLVGRERELGELCALVDAASAQRPRIVLVSGEPGVGKSRVIEEFAGRAREKGAIVLRGACLDLGRGDIPYLPLVEALRLKARQQSGAHTRAAAGPVWDELSGLINGFTGAGGGGRTERFGVQPVYAALLRMLDQLGAAAPVVLVFEDIHWADQSTLDLVSFLSRAMSDERVLLVCSHRAGMPAGHPTRILLAEPDFGRRVRRVAVPPFTEPELLRFLESLGGDVDADMARACFERSEGNAFFAQQLYESGALTDQAAGHLPVSVKELMLARLGTLSTDADRVMRVVATAARRVSGDLIAAVCGLDDESLDQALRECLDADTLAADPMDDVYAVRHALMREAIYERMSPRERIRLHTAMAEALTADPTLSLADGRSAAVELAHHWFSARIFPQALAAAVRAGELTIGTRAFHEAERQYKRALDLWSRVSDPEGEAGTTRLRVLESAADAARWAGHGWRAVEFIEEAIALIDPVRDARRLGELYERLGSYFWEAGASKQTHEAYARAEHLLAGSAPGEAVYARALTGLAMAEVRAYSYDEGLRRARHAAKVAETAGDLAAEGRALNAAGLALTRLGQTEEGISLLRRALDSAKRTEQLEDLFRVYGNICVALEGIGDAAGTLRIAEAGLKDADRFGLQGTRPARVVANAAAVALTLLGRWDEATALLEDTLRDRPPVGESVYERLTLAEVDVARGRFAEARRLIEDVRGKRGDDPRLAAALQVCQAEADYWQGRPDDALASVTRGLTTFGVAEDVTDVLRLHAVGLRAAADIVTIGASEFSADGDDPAVTAAAEALLSGWTAEVLPRLAARVTTPETRVLCRLCDAERDRAAGRDTAAVWAGVAEDWDGLGRPYPAAYAHWRQAAAALAAGDLAEALRVAGAAADAAATLTAAPLGVVVRRWLGVADGPVTKKKAARPGVSGIPAPFDALTAREREICAGIVRGSKNREIAVDLFLAEGTVAAHVSKILGKLELRSRVELATLALRVGFPVQNGGVSAGEDRS